MVDHLTALRDRSTVVPAVNQIECLGLRWGSVDLDASTLDVVRVVIEVDGYVADKPYPKSAKSRRTVPLAPFLSRELRRHRELVPTDP